MSNIERKPNCPMRTSLGNCDVSGGFCTSVKNEVCNALHNAYQVAFLNGQKFERTRYYTPLPKVGEWIDHSDEGYVQCPFCGSLTTCEDNIDELHYCFNCGAKMERGEG